MTFERINFPLKGLAKAAPVLVLAVGTGGSTHPEYLDSLGVVAGYRPLTIAKSPIAAERPRMRDMTPHVARSLEYVRSTLAASMTDLAGLFGVSRQAVYNWIGGEPLSIQNHARLRELEAAAQRIEAAGFAHTPRMMQRELGGRQTLAKAIRGGRALPPLVERLLAMLTEERQQQAKLAARYAGRKTTIDAVRDAAGLSNADET